MKRVLSIGIGAILGASLYAGAAGAEMLAMFNYESKPEESLKALKQTSGVAVRREGIAIMDIDMKSPNYGKILVDMPLPPDLVAHHIFYNKDLTKGYVTALGKPELRVIDLMKNPYRIKTVSVPDCGVGEDVVFSDDNSKWYLSCMGSSTVIVGDGVTDKPIKTIKTPKYPHGIAVHGGINRMLITSTVRASDLKDPGETITAIELDTGKVLKSYKVSNKPSPAGEAPVEILFVPGSNPPVALITNMYGGSLWAAVWDPAKKDFRVQEVYDFAPIKAGVPLELYFNKAVNRLYVTTANPGKFHIFDVSGGALKPKLLKTIDTAGGAHHVAFTPDEKLAYVQNSFINLPGMSDGSITVIDLEAGKQT
jgi:DNA-binding beta-propeller fold protein YncE